MQIYHKSNDDIGSSVSTNRTRTKLSEICRPIIICILLFELCERLTFYSINANFVVFCTKYLEVDNITGINLSLIFTGCIYILCIFMGWISDSVLGKFYTILFSGIVYCGGVALVTLVTFDFKYYLPDTVDLSTLDRRIFSGFGLVMIIIGTGGIKTSVGPFGAQQLKNSNDNSNRIFFLWFYWFVNLGSALAFTVSVYLQQNQSFFIGYLVPLCAIFIALFIFIAPNKYYKQNHKIENNLGIYLGIIFEALKRKSKSIYQYNNIFDYACLSNGGSYEDSVVEGMKKINRIIPVMLTFIPFNIAYFQMQSTYLVQGEHLNLKFSGNFIIPIASLNLVNNVVILFIIPVLAVIIYPIIIRCCGSPPTALQRIGFGLFLCAISVCAAGIVEIIRKHDLKTFGGINQTVFNKTYNVTHLSILSQIPQFFFVGAGEVFASTTGLEFAYSQAPVEMQSVISGLYYMMLGIGSFSGSIIILIVNSFPSYMWMPSDIDAGYYENFYFLLGGIILLDIVVFIFIARNYRYASSVKEKKLVITYSQIVDND